MIECPCCDRVFDNERGMKVHKGMSHDRIEPWEDKTTMEYLHLKKRMSSGKIADVLPCNQCHVTRWLKKHGIQRSPSEAAKIRKLQEPPHHRWHYGYEQVLSTVNGKQEGIQIHRLVAIAEFGFENVSGNVVHHKNGVRWDNRPDNLEVMEHGEHQSLHRQRERERKEGEQE